MTSEVAVMNRLAVALAADSAVSISAGRRNKVYNSANKLFMLSHHHPVGVMVYANGSLMGVPWEVLIKTFRNELGSQECDSLEEYGHRFMAFLEGKKRLFTAELESTSYLKLVESEYEELANRIQKAVQKAEASTGDEKDWPERRKLVVKETIQACHEEWAAHGQHSEIAESTGDQLRGLHSEQIHKLVAKHFRAKAWQAEGPDVHLLNELTSFFIDKDWIARSSFSGVVIAGFGRDDYFPVLQRFRVGDFYDGKLKKTELPTLRISESKPVHVGVYADSDMADLFLKGVSKRALDVIVEDMFKSVAEIVDATLDEAAVDRSPELTAKVAERRDEILTGVVGRIQEFRLTPGEFELALVHIPKDELASVAASLVNLNSFKKRMSMGTESVGGPVDVAVISKGDGFIWIDRKHYFDADKNPHFMRRHAHSTDSQAEG